MEYDRVGEARSRIHHRQDDRRMHKTAPSRPEERSEVKVILQE